MIDFFFVLFVFCNDDFSFSRFESFKNKYDWTNCNFFFKFSIVFCIVFLSNINDLILTLILSKLSRCAFRNLRNFAIFFSLNFKIFFSSFVCVVLCWCFLNKSINFCFWAFIRIFNFFAFLFVIVKFFWNVSQVLFMFWYVFKTCLTIEKSFSKSFFIKRRKSFKLTKLNFLTKVLMLFFNMQRYVSFFFWFNWWWRVCLIAIFHFFVYVLWKMNSKCWTAKTFEIFSSFFRLSFRNCSSSLFLIEISHCCCFSLFDFEIFSITS